MAHTCTGTSCHYWVSVLSRDRAQLGIVHTVSYMEGTFLSPQKILCVSSFTKTTPLVTWQKLLSSSLSRLSLQDTSDVLFHVLADSKMQPQHKQVYTERSRRLSETWRSPAHSMLAWIIRLRAGREERAKRQWEEWGLSIKKQHRPLMSASRTPRSRAALSPLILPMQLGFPGKQTSGCTHRILARTTSRQQLLPERTDCPSSKGSRL